MAEDEAQDTDGRADATIAVTAGRAVSDYFGFVNPPVYHGSTVLYPSARAFRSHDARYTYGSRGTPTTEALETAIARLERAEGCHLTGSGRAAIVLALLSVLKAGDHLLLIDNVYRPTRVIADRLLSRLGIETSYFDPLIGAGLAALMRDNTRAVFLECPGSQTFEMCDVPAIAAAAKSRGAVTMIDNTWATPLYLKPFAHGADISIHAATKYIVGHSDAMLGAVTAVGPAWQAVTRTFDLLRICAGPDDAYLGQRGIRTMAVRLARQMESGLAVARWLEARPEVAAVLHPGLPSHPGHAIWRRDFTGASGLFSFILKETAESAVDAFLDALSLFGLGASWGGYESLAIPFDPTAYRTATQWRCEGSPVRLHIGLEDVADLTADLERGFAALERARRGRA